MLAEKSGASRWATPFAAGLLITLLLALTLTGQWPQLRSRVPFSANGLLTMAPADISRLEVLSGADSIALRRLGNGWSIDGTQTAVPAELASHVDTALRFLNVSQPTRAIPADELSPESFSQFGLDPPTSVVTLEGATSAVTVSFGASNPADTSQYVRLGGTPAVYLLARHVGAEWRVVSDMARRMRGTAAPALASRATSLLLPVSMAQIWAAEIVHAGKLIRFERDVAGNWFRHTGQHSHAGATSTHVADPAQAPIIAAALNALDTAAIETRVKPADQAQLAEYGLNLPPLIVLLYVRDTSTPLVRLEFGGAADSLDRYARLAPDGGIVTVAEFEARRLTELLKTVGPNS